MLQPNEVHLWQIKWQDHIKDKDSLFTLLDDKELTRFHDYKNVNKANKYLITHGILRVLLGQYMGIASTQIAYRRGDYGKLSLADEQRLFFNLSYGKELTVIALTRASAEIGVDIEKVRPVKYMDNIVRSHFSEVEQTVFDHMESGQRLLAFYRGWTRKEAYIKAIGKGLSLPLQSFSVSLDSSPQILNDDKWNLYEFRPAGDHVGTVAIDKAVEVSIQMY